LTSRKRFYCDNRCSHKPTTVRLVQALADISLSTLYAFAVHNAISLHTDGRDHYTFRVVYDSREM